jgi:hypothetical protein
VISVLRIEIVFSMKLTPGMAAMLVRRRQSDASAGVLTERLDVVVAARASRDELG